MDLDNTQNDQVLNAYSQTKKSLDDLLENFSYYKAVMGLFQSGKATIELKKRFMLKMIDEKWVRMIEDTIPSLDLIIRNPGRLLQETEELRPIEQTRKVSSRSIIHLSQHTDLINEIRSDGTVMPSKLLNVFQDDTILTYENRFINTLITRLYTFVCLRVDAAEECGVDEKTSTLTFEQDFVDGERHGNISLKIQYSEEPHEYEVVKNYVYTSDLWKRVLKIRKLVTSYMDSSFCHMVGKNFVRPPVMRTNMLLKNVDFRQCLTLWEFLESYENLGYETLIQEDVEKVDNGLIADFYATIAEQYVLFLNHVRNSFEFENALDSYITDKPIDIEIKSELDQIDKNEFTYSDYIPEDYSWEFTPEEEEIDFAVRVALAADSLSVLEEQDDSEEVVTTDQNKILYRYRYSFLSRLILAGDPTQEFYTEIKNYLLSFKKVRSKISWNYESFNLGRKKVARINVRGKTVHLYLPLDYTELPTKYHLFPVSTAKRNKDFFALLKVRSSRGVKYAKELIDMVMSMLGAEYFESEYVDYHIPMSTREEMCLFNPPLVKIIGEKGVDRSTLPLAPEVIDTISDSFDIPSGDEPTSYRYRYSFKARLIQSSEVTQFFYSQIKNYALSFKKSKARMSWRYEGFRCGTTFMRIKVRGKSLRLYFNLDKNEFNLKKYHLKDLSESGQDAELPLMLKVRSSRGVKYAKELIDLAMSKVGAKQLDIPDEDYYYNYMSLDQLLACDPPLVKATPINKENDFFNKILQVKNADNELIAPYMENLTDQEDDGFDALLDENFDDTKQDFEQPEQVLSSTQLDNSTEDFDTLSDENIKQPEQVLSPNQIDNSAEDFDTSNQHLNDLENVETVESTETLDSLDGFDNSPSLSDLRSKENQDISTQTEQTQVTEDTTITTNSDQTLDSSNNGFKGLTDNNFNTFDIENFDYDEFEKSLSTTTNSQKSGDNGLIDGLYEDDDDKDD